MLSSSSIRQQRARLGPIQFNQVATIRALRLCSVRARGQFAVHELLGRPQCVAEAREESLICIAAVRGRQCTLSGVHVRRANREWLARAGCGLEQGGKSRSRPKIAGEQAQFQDCPGGVREWLAEARRGAKRANLGARSLACNSTRPNPSKYYDSSQWALALVAQLCLWPIAPQPSGSGGRVPAAGPLSPSMMNTSDSRTKRTATMRAIGPFVFS